MSLPSALADEPGIAPRAVFCVIGHAHRDRAIAEDACAGRFTIGGETVDVGPEPDWVGAALPADRGWRIEWTKFAFALDLANAYAETGEARFVRAWERLVGSYLRQLPPGEGHDDTSDVAARRVQNWIYAWAAFAAVPGFPGVSAALERELLDGIRAHSEYVRDNLTPERNERTLELYALLIVSLALPELDPGNALRALAIAQLHENLLTDVREDGVHREQSTHYHCIALRSFLGARENARRFGLTLPDGYDERLARACEFAMHCHRPDGGIPALSDSDAGSYADLLALAADVLDREDLRWAATAGRAGTPPARRCPSFPRGGYHVQRSGWGDRGRALRDERYLIFDTGPLGDGGHGHYDLLNVEVASDGRPLVVDPGRYTYDEGEPNLRHWFKGTAAHNTVVVDGLDQTPYRPGKPRKGTIARGRLLERHGAPGLDVVVGEATSTVYDAVHTRRVAFVADEYWLIEDHLEAATPHRYDLRFHLAAEAEGEVAVERRGDTHVVRAPGLALVIHGPGAASIEAGWVAPAYGIKRPAPVVSVVVEGACDATFTTAVLPLADGAEVPSVVVRREDEATTVELETPAVTDTVRWSHAGAPLDLGPLRCGATAGVIRRTPDGALRVVAAGIGGGPVWTAWDSERDERRARGRAVGAAPRILGSGRDPRRRRRSDARAAWPRHVGSGSRTRSRRVRRMTRAARNAVARSTARPTRRRVRSRTPRTPASAMGGRRPRWDIACHEPFPPAHRPRRRDARRADPPQPPRHSRPPAPVEPASEPSRRATMSAMSRTGRRSFTRPVVRPMPRPSAAVADTLTW